MRESRGTAAAGVCAVLAAIALGAPGFAASAARRPTPRQVNVALTGSMAITWVGSPAAGCAAVGVCGVSGSLEIHLGNTSSSSVGGPVGPPMLEASDDSAVARVQTTAPDGTLITCADLVPVDFNLAVRRTGGAPHTTIDAPTSLAPPSAGRCAGPTGSDLSRLSLPARPFGAHGYDMSGRSSFTGGPFQVTVLSSVRAHITFGSGNAGPLPFGGGLFGGSGGSMSAGAVKPRSVLEESATVVYRMTAIRGSLTSAFTGLAPPLCGALGACGASGHLTQSFATRGRLSFSGTRIVAHRVGPAAVLADLRHGRLRLFDSFTAVPIRVTTGEAISQSDGVACRDTSATRLGSTASRIRGTTDELLLAPEAGLFPGGGLDPFRTRCPGPSALDVLGPRAAPMATAQVTAGELGDRQLTVVFHANGGFTGSAYRGQRGGSVALSLRLVSRRGVVRRVKLFGGEPPFPVR